MTQYTFFISYASVDKEEVAEPLAKALLAHKFSVWYDEFEHRPGDSVYEKINYGIANSAFGIIIVSESYFSHPWASKELGGFMAKETTLGQRAIIPILHRVDRKFVVLNSPILASYFSISSSIGVDKVVERIFSLFKEDIKSERALSANQRVDKSVRDERSGERLNLFDKSNFDKFCARFDGTKFRGYTITIFDIDRLTQINKIYSDRVGNFVLSMVFKILDSYARDVDFFCRCGDDTFCLINPDISVKVASERVKKMLGAVEAFNWDGVCKELKVSCSAGFAAKDRLEPLQDTIIRAAIGMNAAKLSSGSTATKKSPPPKTKRETFDKAATKKLPSRNHRREKFDQPPPVVRLTEGPKFLSDHQSRDFSSYFS